MGCTASKVGKDLRPDYTKAQLAERATSRDVSEMRTNAFFEFHRDVEQVFFEISGVMTQRKPQVRTLVTRRRRFEIGTSTQFTPGVSALLECTALWPAKGLLFRSSRNHLKWSGPTTSNEKVALSCAERCGVDTEAVRGELKLLREIPSEAGRPFSATVWQSRQATDDTCLIIVHGEVETLLPRCTAVVFGDDEKAVDADDVAHFLDNVKTARHDSCRVGFFARRVVELANVGEGDDEAFEQNYLRNNLTAVGLMEIVDPVRATAAPALKTLRRHGYQTVMLTEESAPYALSIARNVGLVEPPSTEPKKSGGRTLLIHARDLCATFPLKSKTLRDTWVGKDVIVHSASPNEKLQIVTEYGPHICAVLGGGVDDVPAMNASCASIAFGSAPGPVKSAASLCVLRDDLQKFAEIFCGAAA